jgi:LacI family transcriptional regulator
VPRSAVVRVRRDPAHEVLAPGDRRAGNDRDPAKCQMCAPTVSAIEVPTERVGYEAAALLDRLMAGEPPRGPCLVPPSGVVAVRQSTDTSALPDRDVRDAVRLLRERAAQRVRVSDVADELLVSRRSLERRFRAALGVTPHQVLLAARVDLAKRLLLETSLTTDRVARAAGLNSASYLNHVFRRAAGMTPARFRARYHTR